MRAFRLAPPAFQALTIRFAHRAARIITEATVSPAFDPKFPPGSDFPRIPVRALWDTGATGSVVTPKVAANLKIPPTGIVKMTHAGGTISCSTYVIHLALPNHTAIAGLTVSEMPDQPPDFDIIIGMDVIGIGDLSITHVDGRTCMSFRTPSLAENDFVKEWNRKAFANVGRNDDCPCGAVDASGRRMKFKDCHRAQV